MASGIVNVPDKLAYSYPVYTGSVTCANNTRTSLCSFALPQGTTIIQVVVDFSPNATGYRQIFLSTASDVSTDIGAIGMSRVIAVSGTDTILNASFIINHTGTTPITYYLGGIQNSGSSLTAYPRVKLATFDL